MIPLLPHVQLVQITRVSTRQVYFKQQPHLEAIVNTLTSTTVTILTRHYKCIRQHIPTHRLPHLRISQRARSARTIVTTAEIRFKIRPPSATRFRHRRCCA